MYILNVYIEGQRVELFKDENVTLNSSVQNINDLSKVFTDYTQSFTVPASPSNNSTFKHWYNADITGGFSSSVRTPSTLELNYMPFKSGVMQLESSVLKNGIVVSYKITFYSDVVKLSDLFGDDDMNKLDLSAYNHDLTGANVKAGLIGATLESGNIVYPTWFRRNVNIDSFNTSVFADDIEYYAGNLNGVMYNDLNPSIRINRLIDAIEVKYGITFSSDFFSNSNHTEYIYMFLKRAKGLLACDDIEETVKFDNIISTDGNYSAVTGKYTMPITVVLAHTVTITPASNQLNIPYTVLLYQNSTIVQSAQGVGVLTFNFDVDGDAADTTEIKIKYNSTFSFTGTFGNSNLSVSTAAAFTNTSVVNVASNMPKLKVKDFMSSLFKMFNLVIVPTSSTTFDVLTLDAWYTAGSTKDITRYIDIDSINITRPNLNKQINFSYEQTETIIGNKFEENNGVSYGDLESTFTFDGGSLEVPVVFENLVGELLTRVIDKTLSDTHVGKLINSDLEEVLTKPLLFYNEGTYSPDVALAFRTEANVLSSEGVINVVNQYATISSVVYSLNFGTEINTSNLVAQTKSLYADYWNDYITDLYSTKRRVYKYNAIIPHHIFSAIKLNDKLIIRDRKYIINKMKANLTNGKVQLELLNDV